MHVSCSGGILVGGVHCVIGSNTHALSVSESKRLRLEVIFMLPVGTKIGSLAGLSFIV